MKQEIHTIPVVQALESGDECPFCHLHRQTEQRAIRYFAGPGASYMEPTVRGITNQAGFCADHMQQLYDYGNALGSALMLQTHLEDLLLQLQQQTENYEIPKKGLFSRKKASEGTPYPQILHRRLESCAICDQMEENMQRQYRVFLSLTTEPEFRQLVEASKGFCFGHFAKLLEEAAVHLPSSQQAWFYPAVYAVMERNLQRVKADLDWLIAKYDYRNNDAPWGNSKDALQRTIQKLSGIYPADPPYRKD